MKIMPVKTTFMPGFKAHTYDIEPKSSEIVVHTDNNPYLGEEPYLVYGDPGKNEVKMKKENGLYSASAYIFTPNFNYHIKYKDTNAIDKKDGKDYSLPLESLKQNATKIIRNQYKQPLIHALKEGSAVGKLLYKEYFDYRDFEKISEPAIIVTKSAIIPSLNNKNILGFIMTEYDSGTLGHSAANLRHETELSAAVLDSDSIKKLKSFNGKNVEITVADNVLEISETDKVPSPKKFKKIEVPDMEYCEEILTSDKYSPELVGAKAVNLRKLEELVNNGKIDVIIPKSVALPYGFIEKNFPTHTYYFKNEEENDARMIDFLKKLEEKGVDTKNIMVRSAFNGEDLPNYSAAGLYQTYIARSEDFFEVYAAVTSAANSKNTRKAIESRMRHGIPDDKIKPSIVIQNAIRPDYKFTVYTEYGKDNLRIDMYSGKFHSLENYIQPHVFNYNKKTKELTYDSIQLVNPFVTYDENLNVVNIPPVENDLSSDKNLLKQVQKLVDNSLVIEKEFGKPQDIEGGFLGGDIYLWQTRNIVKNV